MVRLLTVVSLLFCVGLQAQERIELGLGAGTTMPIAGETFRKAAETGDGNNFWLGYSLDDNWAVELSLDNLDFDDVNSKHQAIGMGAAYRFTTNFVHPIAKLALTSVQSKSILDATTNSMGAKAAAGIEASFKYVSVGGLLNFYHILKSDEAADLKNTQAWQPSLFVSFHTALAPTEADEDETSTSEAPAATAPVKVAAKDTDSDGVVDEDDKCPNTPAGVVVNKIGCSEKENASVRLNVKFLTGKAEIDSASTGEIDNLAAFMKRFPESKAEIAGHTDSTGSAPKNLELSQQRAEAVKAALVKAGVEDSRLKAVGYGSTMPVADNKTKAGRDQNRRVTADISIDVDKKK